jgi:hypothetical protein
VRARRIRHENIQHTSPADLLKRRWRGFWCLESKEEGMVRKCQEMQKF